MSFILDAIARSEAERRQLEIPSADNLALPDGPVVKSRKPWVFLLLVIALLFNGVLLYLLVEPADIAFFSGAESTPELVSNPPQNYTAMAPIILPMAKDIAKDSADESTLAPIVTVEKTTEPKASSGMAKVVPNKGGNGNKTDVNNSPSKVMAIVTPIQPKKAQPESNEMAVSASERAVVEAIEITEVNNASADTEEGWLRVEPDSLTREIGHQPQAASAGRNNLASGVLTYVKSTQELPDSVRKDLPKVVFSGHLYSSSPKSSIVFIGNGKPVVVGQQIEDELVLYEITASGVIVKFRRYLIEVGVLQNWALN
jgi:general secretion pathway protein B